MQHSALHSHFDTSILLEHSITIRYSITVSIYYHIDMYCRSLRDSLFRGATPHRPGEVATAAGAEDQHSGSPASRQRKRHNDYSWYKKFNKCIEPYNQHMRKRKHSSKHGSKHSTGSHGARGCTKGHEAAFDDSGAREHKTSEMALRDLTEGDRNHTSPQRLLSV